MFVNNIVPLYLKELDNGVSTNDYANAERILESIKGFQLKYGSEVVPSEDRIKAEVLYNKYDIFKRLFLYYFLAGLVYFVFIILQIFNSNKKLITSSITSLKVLRL